MRLPSFHWWRTVFFLIPAISVYTIILGTLSIGSSLAGGRGAFAHWCARAWSWLILATTGVDVEIVGLDRLIRDRDCIFVSNHQSIYDIPILFASLPCQLRIIAKQSLGRFPFLGWHLRRTGHILVNRGRPNARLLRRISVLLGGGRSLLVFPEGTRSVDGRVGPFKGGMFLVAIEAGLPIVPIAVVDSRHVMRKGRLTTCPGRVRLVVHDALPTAGLRPRDAKDLAARARQIIEATLGGSPRPDPGMVGTAPASIAG